MKKNIIFLIFLFQSLLNQIRNQKNFEFLSQFCLSDQFFSQNNGKCESCPLECDGCIETNCLSCKYGQNIDGKCLIENQQCNKGYSLDQIEKICKPCDVPFCLECPQTKKCQKCKDGFLLDTFQSQCIADQDQQLWEKYYKYTCPSLFIENKGDCVQKSICSSFKFQSQNQFSSKINKVIEFPFKNYVIGISNTQAILFDTLNINAIKELLNLYQSQTERYLELISYKQYALIISNINIYAINLDYQGLESRFQYSTITSNSDLDYRKIYINEEKLQIFSLTNNQKNIRQTVINFVQGTTLQFQISQNLNNNGLLIQNENQIIFYFQIFQQHEILVFVSESQITFLDLQKIKLSNLKLESGYNLLSNIVVMMSQKSSENSSLLTFFVFAQVEMIQYKLNAFKIQLDKQNFQSISFSEPQFNFDFFSQNQPEISFHHFNWFAYEIESQIYFLLIADKAKNSQVYKMKFFGVAEAEYFFSGNINYIFEFTGQIDWHSNQKPFLTKTEQNKNLLLIVPFQNQLQFFEIQQNILLSAYQNISFDQDNLSINIQQSQESRSKILLILDQILGQIQLETDGKSIEIMLSSKTLFNSKINQYLGYIQNSKLFLPLDINQQQSQYIFIVFDMNDRYRVQVVELQIEINGNQVFKAQSFISYQQINEEVQQCDLYNDKEVILITTNLGIYQVAYHTLKLIKFLPILNKLAQNQNVIFQSIYSANQLNLQMLIVEGDLLNNQDILVVFGVYQDNWIQNKIDINKLQRKFIYYMEHNQNQLCSLLMIYFQGAFIDASKELLTDISIQQIQFIDQETIGIFLQKNLQDPNSFCFSKIKVQLIDSQNLKLLIEYSEEIPQEFKCNINEQIQIVTCSKAEFYDVSTQVLKIYVFDWQNMDFVKDQDGNAINIGVFNFEINERFDLDFQKVILLNDEYHIYSTFRQTVPGSETFTQIKVLNNYFTYNFQSQQLNEISQFINIVQASSKFYYSNQLIDYTDKASGIQRIFQPISNFQRFINLNYGQIKDDNSYIFSEQSSQLIFRKKNELIAANRFSQFDGQKKIFDSYYKFSIEQLGIIAVQKDEELQFISVDNFEVLQKINTEIGTKFFYSKKYKKLILQQTSIIKVYDLKDFFTQALYTHDLNSNLNTSYNLVCFILEETSYLVCNKFGLYDFENRIFYQNKNLIVSDFRQSPFISENKFYALFNKMTNLFVFSHSKKQFLKNQILSNYTTPSFKIILHPEISDQMIAIGDINFCQIYQLPDFYLLFEQTQKQSNQNMAIQFFYNPEAPSLIIKTIEKLIIHKLPYIISNIPQQIDYKSPYQIYWYTFTENYFYVLSSQRLYDLSRAIYFESINLATGSYKLTNMILTENLNSNTYQYWEEKQIIYSDNILISLGDIQLGWSSEQKLLEYFDRFNFILQIYQGGQIYELKTIDVSEMFPFSKQNSQFIDTVDTTNFNYYFLNNGIEHIIYFNFQSFQIQRSSFGNENSLTLLDIYDALKKKNLKEKFQSSYRSSYKIFPLNSQNSDLKLYGFSWKCKLFVFSQDTIIDIIELSSYKCQIYQFNHEVYLIQGKFLLQVIFINQNIELKPKLNYYNTIQDVYSDQFNKWIFITSEQQNFCVLGLNTSQQMKIQNIEIESQKISLVHFFTSSSLDILTLGLIDSQLQIYQLLNYQPDQVDKSNFSTFQFNFYLNYLDQKQIFLNLILKLFNLIMIIFQFELNLKPIQ